MPHLYITPPENLPAERWKHDRDPVELIHVHTPERPYYVKIKFIDDALCRLSLLTTPIDLILTQHKEILLKVARELRVRVLKSNLGWRLKPDLGTDYLLNEEKLHSFDWRTDIPKIFEIGCGNGGFLCDHAFRTPGTLHIGAEINGFTLRKALRKTARAHLDNIYFIRNNALHILHYFIPDGSLDIIFINFPDPWEKKRYLKRRLIQPETLGDFARALKQGGEVRFTTDHRDYAEDTRRHFLGTPFFILLKQTDDGALPFPTKYEQKWRAAGRQIFQLVFRRTGVPFTPRKDHDRLLPDSLKIGTERDFSSGDTLQAGDFVCVFKDVYKGPPGDVLDTVISLGRYRWNVIFSKESGCLVYDPRTNKKFLTHKIKALLEKLLR